MLKYIARFLGGSNEKKVKKALPIVDYINSLEPEFEKFTDDELRAKTEEFKQILNQRPTSDNPQADRILDIEKRQGRKSHCQHRDQEIVVDDHSYDTACNQQKNGRCTGDGKLLALAGGIQCLLDMQDLCSQLLGLLSTFGD